MCTQPIWIANRSYTRKDHDISLPMSNLAQRPWDVARFRLLVPCGQCEECLKALRNDWYVRLRQELACCRQQRAEAWFVTITIHPRYYARALDDPTWFMRKWLERVRHVTGRMLSFRNLALTLRPVLILGFTFMAFFSIHECVIIRFVGLLRNLALFGWVKPHPSELDIASNML